MGIYSKALLFIKMLLENTQSATNKNYPLSRWNLNDKDLKLSSFSLSPFSLLREVISVHSLSYTNREYSQAYANTTLYRLIYFEFLSKIKSCYFIYCAATCFDHNII